MSTEAFQITVAGIEVAVVRKAIRNLHVGVYPPDGRVRVAAPLALSDDAVRLAVVGKLGWIRRQRSRFDAQPRQAEREMVSGESHYFLGRRYRLRVQEQESGRPKVSINGPWLEMTVPTESSTAVRSGTLDKWYRTSLADIAAPLVAKWQRDLHLDLKHWGIKRMRRKWGSCNAAARRMWLNLELAKAPIVCIEYIIVHELTHLIARKHDQRFFSVLDAHLPDWRQRRTLLTSVHLASEERVGDGRRLADPKSCQDAS